jgi:2-polyprenyl-3-methyl-5-hydroxy-6-metoxy-1,4-benzoquinol methylase
LVTQFLKELVELPLNFQLRPGRPHAVLDFQLKKGPNMTLYQAVNSRVLSLVPHSARRILDVGCGTGTLGERLRQEHERTVVGITYSQREAELASRQLSDVICADLNGFDFSSLGKFDCVIMSHIIEHLYSPEDALDRVKHALEPSGVIIVAIPNVLWWRQRIQFLLGKWRYQEGGILDRTHYRFFDYISSREILEGAGYTILETVPDGSFPLTRPIRQLLGPLATRVDRFMCRYMPGMFAFQFVYLACNSKSPEP